MTYKHYYDIIPKKLEPVLYFDSSENEYPIQINQYVDDILDYQEQVEFEKEYNINNSFFKRLFYQSNCIKLEPTIIPNFVNYYTRITNFTSDPLTDNEDVSDIKNYIVYYYYFLLYVKDKKGCIPIYRNLNYKLNKSNDNIKLKCVVVETINNNLNRVLFTPNENSSQYFWYKYYNITNSIILHNSIKSHNIYPISGKIYRNFGLNNDNCNSKIFKKCSMCKLNDISLKSELFDPFRELLTSNLNHYPIYTDQMVKYNFMY